MQGNKKQVLLKALARTVEQLRGNKSQYMLSAEYGISYSILNSIEKGIKDPQLTTLYKLSEALNVSFEQFISKLIQNLPKNFYIIDK